VTWWLSMQFTGETLWMWRPQESPEHFERAPRKGSGRGVAYQPLSSYDGSFVREGSITDVTNTNYQCITRLL